MHPFVLTREASPDPSAIISAFGRAQASEGGVYTTIPYGVRPYSDRTAYFKPRARTCVDPTSYVPGVGVGLFRLLRGLGLARALLGLVESRRGSAELLGLLERRVCSLGLGANHDGRLSMVTWYRWVIL